MRDKLLCQPTDWSANIFRTWVLNMLLLIICIVRHEAIYFVLHFEGQALLKLADRKSFRLRFEDRKIWVIFSSGFVVQFLINMEKIYFVIFVCLWIFKPLSILTKFDGYITCTRLTRSNHCETTWIIIFAHIVCSNVPISTLLYNWKQF